MNRLFVGLWPDPSLIETIPLARLREAIDRQGVRFTRQDKIHLTLRFLGNVSDSDLDPLLAQLGSALRDAIAPQLTISGIGCFPNNSRPAVVWAGALGDLDDLFARVSNATEAFAERSDTGFAPHLTLARISPPSKKVGIALDRSGMIRPDEIFGGWIPREVVLARTMEDGSYDRLGAFPLRGG
jgi:2'-5' RNA ligase